MFMKRKIIAMSIMVLILLLPLNIAEGSNNSNIKNKESFSLEIITNDPDGFQESQEFIFYIEEFEDIINIFSKIMDQIELNKEIDWNSIITAIVKIIGKDNPLLDKILGIFSMLNLSRNRSFVISSGHGFDINPLDKFTLRLRKKIMAWHYNTNGVIGPRTIIVKPFAMAMKTLYGRQIGFMSKFFGVYFFISKGFLEESYTFFIGTARHINGIQY